MPCASFFRFFAVSFLFLFAAPGPIVGFAAEPMVDGGVQKSQFVRSIRSLFVEEDFARLEKISEKLWAEKSRFTDGCWKLQSFYESFAVPYAERGRFNWDECFARFQRWEEKFPQSLAAPIGHGWALNSYAWEARGNGYSNTVSTEGWRLFGLRLQDSRNLLDARPELKTRPGYYAAMMTVALGQSWKRPEYDQLFAEAVKLAPSYEAFYFSRANYLQPKWNGEEGEWKKFALASAEATKAEMGMALYTRIVWATLGTQGVKGFRDAEIDWPRMRQGFEDIAQKYPDSLWNKNAYCYFAYAAGDRPAVHQLLEELEGHFILSVWPSQTFLDHVKAWASAASDLDAKK